MRGIICGALMVMAMSAANAEPDRNSANYMLPYCKAFGAKSQISTFDSAFERGDCAGMVEALGYVGLFADVSVTAFSGPGRTRAATEKWRCLDMPRKVTTGQIVQVVVHYLENQPQRLHEDFKALALEALFDAWACKN